MARLAHHGGRNVCHVFRDAKALVVQHCGMLGAGSVFTVERFRLGPHTVGQANQIIAVAIHQLRDFGGILHVISL